MFNKENLRDMLHLALILLCLVGVGTGLLLWVLT